MTVSPAGRAGLPPPGPGNRCTRRPIRSITMKQSLSRAHTRTQGTGREMA